MNELITMEGKYAYDSDPLTQVRVVAIDLPGKWPVLTVTSHGDTLRHDAYGRPRYGLTLVPLKRRPREFWVNIYPDGYKHTFTSESAARATESDTAEIIHVREVMDDE